MRGHATFGTLLRGLQCSSSSSSGAASQTALIQAAAAVQWPCLPQASLAQQHLSWQQQQQQQLQPLHHHLMTQPGSIRSLSFLSAAGLQQRNPLSQPVAPWHQHQQQPHTHPLPLQQQLQQHQLVLPQQQFGQQQQLFVRTFVLMPRRVKYRKAHKSMGFNETVCGNTRQLAFGLYGIRALEHCRIPAGTLEAVRRTLRRTIKKSTMLWIRVTPNVPVTSKPAEVRMGKGKGTLDYWAAPIRPGQILFEMDRCSRATAMQAVQAIKAKMPIKVDFVEWS